jgi:osmoprotectant transport system permease protein
MGSVWQYFLDHRHDIEGWTWTTIWLAIVPLAAGLALALPLGWLAFRSRWVYPPLVSGTGLLYTIPSSSCSSSCLACSAPRSLTR